VNYQPKSAERCAIATPKTRDESGTFIPNGAKKDRFGTFPQPGNH
jgi:hypothetical protein